MSTPNTAAPAPKTTADAPVIATMLWGRRYEVHGIIFDRDAGTTSHPVSPETEQQLRDYAFEPVTIEGQEFRKARFKFSNDPAGAEKKLVPAPADTRPRVNTGA